MMLRVSLLLLVTLAAGYSLLWLGSTPSHDRQWQTQYARTPGATIATSTVTLHHIRDWNYSTSSLLSDTWHERVVIPTDQVQAVWFGLARFEGSSLVGHSFLTFELQDGRAYTLSIEARREENEQYHALRGLLPQYELWYGWGTERDFLGVSLFYLGRPLEYYRLDLTPAEAQAVFVAVAHQTAATAAKPAFYHTLRANCTNLLAKAVNHSYPGRLPYHSAWNLPGKSTSYLHQQHLLHHATPVAEHIRQATVDAADPALLKTIHTTPLDFSQQLRAQLATGTQPVLTE